jgi:dTDP-4-dehydrorhamnose reductase
MEKEVILITGSEGQLGHSLKVASNNYKQYDCIFTDIEDLNITSNESVKHFLNCHKVDFIINAAAYTAVDKAEDDLETANLINNVGVKILAEVAKEKNIKLIHVSTDYVFNGLKSSPYTPKDSTEPASVYGKTKQLGEEEAMQTAKTVAVVRTSWLYSEFGNNFVKTMLKLGTNNETLNVVFDQISSPTYAGDLANFLLMLCSKLTGQTIIHYSNEGVCSWYDFARKIMEMANLKCKINPIVSALYPTPAPRPAYSVLDKTETKRLYNIEIPHWEESLQKCIENLRH